MENRVITIWSRGRMGSTFLAFMLGNDPKAVTPGDFGANFYPHPKATPTARTNCYCHNPNCQVWKLAKERGEEEFYQAIFDQGFDLVVDSANNIAWYEVQKKYMEKQSIPFQDVILFKSPFEFAYSIWKRDKGQLGMGAYVNYFTRALNLIDKPIFVEYKDLAKLPGHTLKLLCKKLNLEYFEGKEHFWEDNNWHTWGGSSTAIIHYFDKGSKRYKSLAKTLKSKQWIKKPTVLDHHREIYYSTEWKSLPKEAKQQVRKSKQVQQMYQDFVNRKVKP